MTEAVAWVKWHFDRWRNDEGLRMCGLAARGLWADLLAIMHGCDPYGHLSIKGREPTPKQVASMVGMTSEREVKSLLQELEDAGVFSRNNAGMIYCRRMVRDNAARIAGRQFGATGGNPALKRDGQETGKPSPITGRDNPPGKPREEKKREEREKEGEEIQRKSVAPSRSDKGTRLPDDWQPDAKGLAVAEHEGIDLDRTLLRFRNYWKAKPGKEGRKTDWDRTWENWCTSGYNTGNGRANGAAVLGNGGGLWGAAQRMQAAEADAEHDRGAIDADDWTELPIGSQP
jgi:hypothetical protein